MALPTEDDATMSQIDNLSASIMTRLSIMRHAGQGNRDFAGLREILQQYVDEVMDFAHRLETQAGIKVKKGGKIEKLKKELGVWP